MLIDDLVIDLLADASISGNEIALYVAVASERDELDVCSLTSSDLAARLRWARNRVIDARDALAAAGYITVDERDGRHPLIRLITPCGDRDTSATGGCASSPDPRGDRATPLSDPRGDRAGRDLPSDLSTSGVDDKPLETQAETNISTSSTAATTTPPYPPLSDELMVDVDDSGTAPPEAAAPRGSVAFVVNAAIEILVDRELDRELTSARVVHNYGQFREHLRRKWYRSRDELARFVEDPTIDTAADVLERRDFDRQLEQARVWARRLAHIRTAEDVDERARSEFRGTRNTQQLVDAAVAAYEDERPAGRASWEQQAAEFGAGLAGLTLVDEAGLRDRASRRFDDAELVEVAAAAWRAAVHQKARAS